MFKIGSEMSLMLATRRRSHLLWGEHMKRYVYIMFLYAFSPIFLSTNLSAAGWHCAAATGRSDSARHSVGQNPQSARGRDINLGVVCAVRRSRWFEKQLQGFRLLVPDHWRSFLLSGFSSSLPRTGV
jgi:hypothetical protein